MINMETKHYQLLNYPEDKEREKEDRKKYYEIVYNNLSEIHVANIKDPNDEDELINYIQRQPSFIGIFKRSSSFYLDLGLTYGDLSIQRKKFYYFENLRKLHYEEVKSFYIQVRQYYEGLFKQVLPKEIMQIMNEGYKRYLQNRLNKEMSLNIKKECTFEFIRKDVSELKYYYGGNEELAEYYYNMYLIYIII